MYEYKEDKGQDCPFFTFETEQNLSYYVAFRNMQVETLPLCNLESIDFSEVDKKKGYHDIEVSTTIIEIINNYINRDSSIIIHYICDSSDKKQHFRNKLFNRWFDLNNKEMVKYDIRVNEDYTLTFLYNQNIYETEIIESEIILMLDALERDKS